MKQALYGLLLAVTMIATVALCYAASESCALDNPGIRLGSMLVGGCE